jgi:ketosteroid isomerase-like protein
MPRVELNFSGYELGLIPRLNRKGLSEMRNVSLLILILSIVLATAPAARETNEELALQVRAAETAFAKTMAERNHSAFVSYIADEAVFFGGKGVLRGKAAVGAGWKPLFEGSKAPFSWEPERVEVLDSGKLALSTGPVRGPEGQDMGTFMSIWRREAKGRWRIVFDKGCPPCDPTPTH